MIADIVLRWALTAVFVISAGHCVMAVRHRGSPWPERVGHGIHLVMCLAMSVMAWPFSMGWPTIGPMVFFLAAAVWFPASRLLLGWGGGLRLRAIYHGGMMLAMAFMYAVMTDGLLSVPRVHPVGTGSGGHEHHHGGDMADMPGMNQADHASAVVPGNEWIQLGIAFCVAACTVAAVFWLHRYFSRGHTHRPLCEFLMAAGMAAMFTVML